MCLGIPGQIVAISNADDMLGIVDVSGVRREIHLACIVDDEHPIETCVGDWVLVHVGFAMSRIDEAEAAQTLALLAEIGAIEDQYGGQGIGRDQVDVLASLYPFLYGSRKDEPAENAALLHSVSEKAAHSIEVKRSFFGGNSNRVVAAARAIAEVYRRNGRMFRWATGDRVAMRLISRSSSSTRSPPGARLCRRSI